MPDLNFQIDGAKVAPFAAIPEIGLNLQIRCLESDLKIQNVLLQCQVQIEPARRKYRADEQRSLRDLFGEPQRWGSTLHAMVWTHANLVVPSFESETVVNLPLPCTFDFNVAATKYLYGVTTGSIPISVLFSGSVFYWTQERHLQVARIPWEREAGFLLPVQLWRELMDTYYPNTAWLSLRRDVFERLYQYKLDHGIPTWEGTIDDILGHDEEKKVDGVPV